MDSKRLISGSTTTDRFWPKAAFEHLMYNDHLQPPWECLKVSFCRFMAQESGSQERTVGDSYRIAEKFQPGWRLTSTMPPATSASEASKVGVTASPSQSEPDKRPNKGVRKTNAEILVAG